LQSPLFRGSTSSLCVPGWKFSVPPPPATTCFFFNSLREFFSNQSCRIFRFLLGQSHQRYSLFMECPAGFPFLPQNFNWEGVFSVPRVLFGFVIMASRDFSLPTRSPTYLWVFRRVVLFQIFLVLAPPFTPPLGIPTSLFPFFFTGKKKPFRNFFFPPNFVVFLTQTLFRGTHFFLFLLFLFVSFRWNPPPFFLVSFFLGVCSFFHWFFFFFFRGSGLPFFFETVIFVSFVVLPVTKNPLSPSFFFPTKPAFRSPVGGLEPPLFCSVFHYCPSGFFFAPVGFCAVWVTFFSPCPRDPLIPLLPVVGVPNQRKGALFFVPHLLPFRTTHFPPPPFFFFGWL